MTIDEARDHINDSVVYAPAGHFKPEAGTIVRVTDHWVFVRYGDQVTPVATPAEELTLT